MADAASNAGWQRFALVKKRQAWFENAQFQKKSLTDLDNQFAELAGELHPLQCRVNFSK